MRNLGLGDVIAQMKKADVHLQDIQAVAIGLVKLDVARGAERVIHRASLRAAQELDEVFKRHDLPEVSNMTGEITHDVRTAVYVNKV